MEQASLQTSILQRSGDQKQSFLCTTSSKPKSPSRIPIPSRLCNLPSKTHQWLPSSSKSSPHYTRVSLQTTTSQPYTSSTPSHMQADSSHSSRLAFIASGRQTAWEEKQYSTVTKSPLPSEKKKTVTFSATLPSYQYTSLYSQHTPPPENLEIVDVSGADDTDTDNSLLLHTRNGFHKHLMTDTKVLEVLEGALQTMREKQQQLQREHERVVCEMREKHRSDMSRERERLQNQILTLAGMNSHKKGADHEPDQSKEQTVRMLEQRLATKAAECCNLQAELDARKVAAESEISLEKSKTTLLQAQVESLQSRLATKETEIKELKTKLDAEISRRLRLELSSEEEKQQLLADLAAAQQHNASLEYTLSMLNRELAHSRQKQLGQSDTESLERMVKLSQREVDRLQKLLSEDRQRVTVLQEKEMCANSEIREGEESTVAVTTEDAVEKTEKSADLLETHGVNESVEGVSVAGGISELQTRNAMLAADLGAAREIQHSLEKKITLLEQKLEEHSSSKLQESQMEVEELAKTKGKLQREVEASKLLQEELKCTQQECAVLQDQLQLQRETAALSLNRVEQAGYRKQKKLAHLIKDLRKELREAESAEKKVESDCLKYKAEMNQQKAQLNKTRERNRRLNTELREKRRLLTLAEDQISEMTETLQLHKRTKDSLKSELAQERQTHTERRAELNKAREELETVEMEREELKQDLSEMLAVIAEEQERNRSLEGMVTRTNQQLSELKRHQRKREDEAEKNLEMLWRAHQTEIKAKMSEINDLKATIKNLRQREKVAKADRERARDLLKTQEQQLTTRLEEVNRALSEEKDNSRTLHEENSLLKSGLRDLQSKMTELTRAQEEYEDYTHKAEETRKSEMEQLLEEMTQHMQQQSDSHKYLEKLRTENERMTLQEKDRQIKELKGEVAGLQESRSQEQALIESLKFENQIMRTGLRGSRVRSGNGVDSCTTASDSQPRLPPIQ